MLSGCSLIRMCDNDRYLRGRTQKIFLISVQYLCDQTKPCFIICEVMGTTGNVYTVSITETEFKCTCPDYHTYTCILYIL